MRRIVYISTADALSEGQLDAIVAGSVRNNVKTAVSGFLLYNGRNFLQLIEGEHAEIGDLIGVIEADDRHDGLVRLIDEGITTRACPDWAMWQIALHDDLAKRRDALMTILPALDDATGQLVNNFALLN